LRKVSFPIKIGFKNRLDINLKKVGNDKPQEGKRMCLKNTTVGGVGKQNGRSAQLQLAPEHLIKHKEWVQVCIGD
jgi:hypothetical protein